MSLPRSMFPISARASRMVPVVPILAAAVAVMAATAPAGPVDWPLTWREGEQREFMHEYTVERRTAIDANWTEEAAGRMRWRETVAFDRVAADGYVQTWTARDAQFEALTGGDELSQALSPTLKDMESTPMIFELGPDRRLVRVRNFAKIQQILRDSMTPLMREASNAAMAQVAPKFNPEQRKAIQATLDARMEQTLSQLLEKKHLQASLSEFARLHNRWQGERLPVGKQERRRDQLLTPNFYRPVEAIISYEADLPKGHADLVRVRWTSEAVQADASGQWTLAEEMAGVRIPAERRREGPPRGLSMRQRGVLAYRRSDGALQGIEVVTDTVFGPNARRDHLRTRSAETTLDWKPFALKLEPLQPAERPPGPGDRQRRR